MLYNGKPIEKTEKEQGKFVIHDPEFYLKNLAEYKKMLELLSLNEHLTDLLSREEQLVN